MKTIVLFVALGAYAPLTYAQKQDPKIYWVLETNVNQRGISIVKFYDDMNLVYETRFEGRTIDVHKPRHVRKLNSMARKYVERTSTVNKSKNKTSRLIL